MKTSTEIIYILNPKEILNTINFNIEEFNSTKNLAKYLVETSIFYLDNIYINELQNIFQIKQFQQLFLTKNKYTEKTVIPEFIHVAYELSEYFFNIYLKLKKYKYTEYEQLLIQIRNNLENYTNTTDNTKLIKYSYYAIMIITTCYYFCTCEEKTHYMSLHKCQKIASNIAYYRNLFIYDLPTYKYFRNNFFNWINNFFPSDIFHSYTPKFSDGN